jgi:spermidine synthase
LLVCASVLFFPPLLLLGMVGPYAIRLGTRSVDEVGRVSGNLFAVSTLASVAAALATGFMLIPVLGVTRLLAVVAVALFVAAGIAWLAARSTRGALVAMLGIGLAVAVGGRTASPVPGVLAKLESRYAQLRVIDVGDLRYLLIDGSPHTILDLSEGEPRQPHVYAAEIATDLFARHGRLLLLGLGGGAMAEVFSRHGWQVDAVEVDREVARLATQFFRLQPFHARVVRGVARAAGRRARARYDVVMFDACGGASIPFQLVTREAFAEAKAHLMPDGVVMLNTEAVGWQDPIVHALAATLRTQFRNVFALPTAEPPNEVGNVILMASDRPLVVTPEQLGDPVATLSDDDEHFRVLSRHHAWENRYDPRRGKVLTDDWNPIDLRGDAINRAMRAKMRTLLPDSLIRD